MEIVSCLSSVGPADRPEATNHSAPFVDRFQLRLNQLVHTEGGSEVDSGIFWFSKVNLEECVTEKTQHSGLGSRVTP